MNAVDSARMLSLLSSADYRAAATLEEADLVLLNTCSIREKADQKIYSDLGTLRRWKQRRPGRLVGVGGCLAQQDGEALRERAQTLEGLDDIEIMSPSLDQLYASFLQDKQGLT